MWCGTKPVMAVLVAVAVAAFATPAQAPFSSRVRDARAEARHPATCKPLPPLTVDASPAAGSTNRWMLSLRSLETDGDVQVWMQTTPKNRRIVWRGHLSFGEERQIEVVYDAPAAAERVFVALEPTDMGANIVRGLAVCEIPGRAQVTTQNGHLFENPDTGVKVRQFTGAVGGQR